MYQGMIGHLVQGYLAPRSSLARFSGAATDFRTLAELALLGFLLQSIGILFVDHAHPDVALRGTGGTLGNALYYAIRFSILCWLVLRIGRAFGGQAGLDRIVLAIAWYQVLSALPLTIAMWVWVGVVTGYPEFANPEQLQPETMDPRELDMLMRRVLLMMLLVGQLVWLFACLVAEAHRFEQVWGTLGVTLLAGLVLFILMSALVGVPAG